jgi:4-amino-4-deoxy-L-arabinose transferase-like glycosyltransferase
MSSDPDTQVWLARCGNLLLAAALPAVLYWALCAAVLPVSAALAAGVFLLYPAFLRSSAQPLTEPLFLLLQFASLGLFLRASSPRMWAGAGLTAGLAFLTRPSGLLLPAVYLVALLCRRDAGPGGKWPPLAMLVGGFLLPLIPYLIGVAVQTGSPFTSVLRYNYSIGHIDEGTLDGFERVFPSPLSFVAAQPGEVARLVAKQWETMGLALLRSLRFLLPLAFFWRGGPGWGRGVLLALAGLNFLFHAMSWTVWGAARYMFPSFILGMALLLDAPLRWWCAPAEQESDHRRGGRKQAKPGEAVLSSRLAGGRSVLGRRGLAWGAVAASVALTLIVCLEQDVRLFREKKQPYAGVELGWAYASAVAPLSGAGPDAVCAANQPWIVNLLVRRPAVMAPRFRDAFQVRRYVSRYRPATLTLFLTERRPRDVRAALVLVDDLWGQPRLRPELADLLTLEAARYQPGPQYRQALLMFRIKDNGAVQGGS